MLETILQLQNPHWDDKSYQNLFERSQFPALVNKLKLKEVQILLGIRRSGKSTLFKLLINHLLTKEVEGKSILYLNLDDPLYAEIWPSSKLLYKVIESAEKLTGVKPVYLFLDEIQNVEAWERFVKSVYDMEIFKKIFITGSNSSLLKSQYATLLSGRYLIDYVMPLSFREIIHNEGINTLLELVKAKPKILRIMETLLYYGGFPEIWKTKEIELKREQLVSYYETILLKDCIANHKVRETKKLQELALYLLNNNATLFSYNGLSTLIESNENTVKEFISILENSFLIREIRQFSYSLKNQSRARKKTYCVDNGLIHAVSLKFSENKGRLLENLVYNELCKMKQEDIYFFNDQTECDFIVKVGKKYIPIQVTFELTNDNYDREVNGLKTAMKNLSAHSGYIITFDSEEKVLDNNITIVPLWKFLFLVAPLEGNNVH